MRQKVELLLIFLLLMLSVGGNNIKVSGAPELVLGSDGSSVELTFQLSWENSWRDEFNWDAAWVFVKYKKEGSTAAWSHLNLGETHVVPSGFSYDCGKSAGKAVGLFIYRDGKSGGNVPNQNVTLKTTLASLSGVTADDLRNKKVYVAVSAIEMVYVPYGAYYLGDAASNNTFKSLGADGIVGSYLVDSENAIPLGTAAGQLHAADGNSWTGSLAAAYPKGYRGFYCMKYELSQEQYVSFLNMLSYDQQKAHIGNPLDGLKKGDYIFSDRNSPSARNGIAVFAKQAGKPVLFANNLTKDDVYFAANDGQTIACNYLTPGDMLAYCDWSGLRPMSEMEYEKSCRRPYPQSVVAKEYAWNKNTFSKINAPGDLSGLNTDAETPVQPDRNVNVGNPALGPVRCGSFGFGSSTQTQSGGTFWGAMEMSGNVGEICYSAVTGGRAFNATDPNTSHGTGVLNTNGTATIAVGIWPVATTATNFTLRGGSFASGDTCLRVSDRTVLSVGTVRDSSIGFRAVRTLGGGSVTLDAGSIIAGNGLAIDTACPGVPLTIKSSADARLTGMSDIPVSYIWYLNDKIVPDESGAELRYDFENGTNTLKTIVIKRKAVCAVGEKESSTIVTIKVPNLSIKLSPERVTMDVCNNTTPVVASPAMSGVTTTYTWSYNGSTVPGVSGVGGATYTPSIAHFSGNTGDLQVICTAMINGCLGRGELTVSVPDIILVASADVTQTNCGRAVFYDDRDGDRKIYCTVKIGDQCWMGENLNIGTYTKITTSDYWVFDEMSIQKWCYGENISNCNIHGGLYEWWEVICGGYCGENKLTPANALSLNFANNEADLADYGAKMVPGSSTMVQGVCPDGWHIPSDGEWRILGSNPKGWGGLLSGMRIPSGSGFSHFGSYSWWWSSTSIGAANAWDTRLPSEVAGEMLGHYSDATRAYGFSVRCLKN